MTAFTVLIILANLMSPKQEYVVFKFQEQSELKAWRIINDGVMGGVSQSQLKISNDGYGQFSGHVSLDNNGGFASVMMRLNSLDVKPYTKVSIKLKGDGKSYQLRLKHKASDYHNYVHSFDTSGEWETIVLPLIDFYPSFRGRTLDYPNFEADYIEEIRFLIANKKEEDFNLLIDEIKLI